MQQRIGILGAYGGVGRGLAHLLAPTPGISLLLAGRKPEKLEQLRLSLLQIYPQAEVHNFPLNIFQEKAVRTFLQKTDLALLTTPTPEAFPRIAQIAVEESTHLIDILLDQKHLSELQSLDECFQEKSLFYLTQAGVHPGLPSTMIRYAAQEFDQMESARFFLSMKTRVPNPDATVELVHEIGSGKSYLLENGHWRKAGYRDMLDVDFGPPAGKRSCYPLNPQEIRRISEKLKLQQAGLYSSGFNWLVDFFVLPLILLLYPRMQAFLQKLLFWSNNLLTKEEHLILQLQAKGVSNGATRQKTYRLQHPDPYFFTAAAVVASIFQHLSKQQIPPGIHPMGYAVDPSDFFTSLQQMGIIFEEKPAGNA